MRHHSLFWKSPAVEPLRMHAAHDCNWYSSQYLGAQDIHNTHQMTREPGSHGSTENTIRTRTVLR